MIALSDRFYAKVNSNGPVPTHRPELGPCHVWIAGCDRGGYGTFRIGSKTDGSKKNKKAHRVAWFLKYGMWPEPCCLHACDNRKCVNVAHLSQGTKAANMADRDAKGRQVTPHGEHNGRAKLTELKALEVLRRAQAGETQRSIARDFSVDQKTVSHIVSRRTWRHLRASESSSKQKGGE